VLLALRLLLGRPRREVVDDQEVADLHEEGGRLPPELELPHRPERPAGGDREPAAVHHVVRGIEQVRDVVVVLGLLEQDDVGRQVAEPVDQEPAAVGPRSAPAPEVERGHPHLSSRAAA
jgi:hypothetical protein